MVHGLVTGITPADSRQSRCRRIYLICIGSSPVRAKILLLAECVVEFGFTWQEARERKERPKRSRSQSSGTESNETDLRSSDIPTE